MRLLERLQFQFCVSKITDTYVEEKRNSDVVILANIYLIHKYFLQYNQDREEAG